MDAAATDAQRNALEHCMQLDPRTLNALVQTIAQEVLARLQERTAEGPCVQVLAEREARLETQVRERLGNGADAVLCFQGEDTAGRRPCRHILPRLSCSDMADLAAGRAPDQPLAGVLALLLAGEEVEVLEFDYKAHAQTAPGPLFRLYEAYARTLETYGLRECPRPRPERIHFREDLVTAKDVTQAAHHGARVLEIPATARVTPLAAEAAASLRLTIQKERQGGTACTSAG